MRKLFPTLIIAAAMLTVNFSVTQAQDDGLRYAIGAQYAKWTDDQIVAAGGTVVALQRGFLNPQEMIVKLENEIYSFHSKRVELLSGDTIEVTSQNTGRLVNLILQINSTNLDQAMDGGIVLSQLNAHLNGPGFSRVIVAGRPIGDVDELRRRTTQAVLNLFDRSRDDRTFRATEIFNVIAAINGADRRQVNSRTVGSLQ
jgi:hypothetical protein